MKSKRLEFSRTWGSGIAFAPQGTTRDTQVGRGCASPSTAPRTTCATVAPTGGRERTASPARRRRRCRQRGRTTGLGRGACVAPPDVRNANATGWTQVVRATRTGTADLGRPATRATEKRVSRARARQNRWCAAAEAAAVTTQSGPRAPRPPAFTRLTSFARRRKNG